MTTTSAVVVDVEVPCADAIAKLQDALANEIVAARWEADQLRGMYHQVCAENDLLRGDNQLLAAKNEELREKLHPRKPYPKGKRVRFLVKHTCGQGAGKSPRT